MDFSMSIDYLPIGSIVKLNNEGKKVMIIGYFVASEDEPLDIYDYCGCLYPEGYDDLDDMYLFDEEQIDEVLFIGYEDEEGKNYRKDLAEDIDAEYDVDESDASGDSSFNSVIAEDTEEIERL